MLSLKYQNHNSILWWNIQKHNIPVDGIKVKFGAKVNSDQTKQSIKQNKSNLESWKKSHNQTLKDLEDWKTEEF